jgi:hypothetical protein
VAHPVTLPDPPAEAYVGNAVTRLTAEQRAAYLSNVPKVSRVAKRGFSLRTETAAPVKIGAGKHPQIRAVPDPKLVAKKNAQIEALKKAYGGAIPAAPNVAGKAH